MGVDKGYLNTGAFKKAPTWGTAVTAVALDGFEYMSESIIPDVQLIEDEQNTGAPGQRAATAGNKIVGGSVRTAVRYEGLEPIIAQVFGTAGNPTTVDTSGKQHKLRIANSVEGLFGTLVLAKIGIPEIHEFTTAKVLGFTFRAQQGKRAEIEFRFACHDHNINTSSGQNTNTSFASVTIPSNREFAQFSHLAARYNAQGGAGLTSGDVVYGVVGVEVSVDRQLKTDDVTTRFGNKIDEPTPTGNLKVSGSLEFSKYESGTGGGSTAYPITLSKAAQKMDWKFIGATLAGSSTQFFEWDFFFPYIQFGTGRPVNDGPGIGNWSIPFSAWRVPSAPTGMTGITENLGLDIYSQRSSDPLA